MEQIKNSIEKARINNLVRRRERYAYAKKKGFDSYESTILAGHSKKYIDELAKMRAEIDISRQVEES